ncbi:hypothetical protein G4B88_015028 [Cannabis sativa]|uniref:Uncharacterized protein n=1 Tax=Cannabis sativa TaxID=3483 RepID=A0A7J6E168_CANSA|nr:hypothetical protein G4B88_015028 [Cannabis sativa]
MPNGLDDVPGSGLTLGADHGRALANTAEGLTEVAAAADEGDPEVVLVDVIFLVGEGEDLALVDVVDSDGLEDLGLDEVADSCLGHNRNGHSLLDFLDELWVTHSGDASLGTNVSRNTLQGHDGARTSLLGDAGLLGVHHVHDNSATEHLGKADFHRKRRFLCRFVNGAISVDGDYSRVCHYKKKKKLKLNPGVEDKREAIREEETKKMNEREY